MVSRFILLFALVSMVAVPMWAQPGVPILRITEVSWGDPDCVEITNFDNVPVGLAGWTITFRVPGLGDVTSMPFPGFVLPSGGMAFVRENSGDPNPQIESPVVFIVGFPANINLTGQPFAVALRNPMGAVVDEVNVSDALGFPGPGVPPFTTFAGVALRGVNVASTTTGSVERIWGLDSDRGSDWTEQLFTSFGQENTNSGVVGTDPTPMVSVSINEISNGPLDYIELYRAGPAINLADWFLLISEAQDSPIVRKVPFTAATPIGGANPYVVIGESAIMPAETPAGTTYASVGVLGLTTAEYTIGLYDPFGRCVDLVRTTRVDSELVHNEPRLPAHFTLFAGAARRSSVSNGVLGRLNGNQDGAAWAPLIVRTMGLPNAGIAAPPGHADTLDVRLNDGPADNNGLHCIINTPDAWAGFTYSIAPSFVHANGLGPILGLAPDAIPNYLALVGVPPFSGIITPSGHGRFDFPAGTLPPGIDIDLILLIQSPGGALVARTLCLAYDS